MLRYIIKRVLAAIVTIWFIMTLTFFLMNAIPGDPFTSEKMADPVLRQAMAEKYGLDKPLLYRYGKYIADYLRGDFGLSYAKRGLKTNEIIISGFPYSIRIGAAACIMVVGLGILFGVIAALRQNRFVDRLLMLVSTLGATIPSFVFATGFLFLFSKVLAIVPSFGVESWKGYIGPSVVIALFSLSFITRLMRTTMLEVLNQDYIRTARAKGISEIRVIGKHAVRNAVLPVITYIGPAFAELITGSFVVEKIFGVPGIGSLFTVSILNRDYTMIMGVTVFFALLLVVCVLAVDLIYVLIDPRIKYE